MRYEYYKCPYSKKYIICGYLRYLNRQKKKRIKNAKTILFTYHKFTKQQKNMFFDYLLLVIHDTLSYTVS